MSDNLEELDRYRNEWNKYSSSMDPDGLIDNIYAEDSYYFGNYNTLINTPKRIKKTFSGMKNYKITIEPLVVYEVNKNTTYEIGVFNNNDTYGGHYIIVWQNYNNGEWKVFLDANI